MSQPSHSSRLRHAEDDPFKSRSGDPESGRHATLPHASPHCEVMGVAELVIGQETLLSFRDYLWLLCWRVSFFDLVRGLIGKTHNVPLTLNLPGG